MSRKKILAATDLSERSDIAIDKAIEIAAKYDMWLEVLHVIGLPLFEMFFGEQYEHRMGKESEEEKEKLKQISDKIKEGLSRKSDKIYLDVKFGNPREEIVDYAHKNADLIVLGSSGEYTSIEEFVLGTTVKSVVDNSTIPVLVVKNRNAVDAYKKVAVVVDYSELSAKAVNFIGTFFAESEITLITVCELPSEFRLKYYGLTNVETESFIKAEKDRCGMQLGKFISDLEVDSSRINSVVIDGSLNAKKVIEVARESGVGLVCVAASKLDDFISKIIGNVASEIVEKSPIDTLVYRG